MRILPVLFLVLGAAVAVGVLLYVRSNRGPSSSDAGDSGRSAAASGSGSASGSESGSESGTESGAATRAESEMRDYTVAEFVEVLEADSDVQLVDVRTKKEWDEGHLEDAIFIPVAELPSRLSELDESKSVVTYCAAGGRSAKAMKILDKNGFEVRGHLKPGIRGWIAEGKPVVE